MSVGLTDLEAGWLAGQKEGKEVRMADSQGLLGSRGEGAWREGLLRHLAEEESQGEVGLPGRHICEVQVLL